MIVHLAGVVLFVTAVRLAFMEIDVCRARNQAMGQFALGTESATMDSKATDCAFANQALIHNMTATSASRPSLGHSASHVQAIDTARSVQGTAPVWTVSRATERVLAMAAGLDQRARHAL